MIYHIYKYDFTTNDDVFVGTAETEQDALLYIDRMFVEFAADNRGYEMLADEVDGVYREFTIDDEVMERWRVEKASFIRP